MFKDGVVLAAISLIVIGAGVAWWVQSTAHSASHAPLQVQESQPPPPPAPPVTTKKVTKAKLTAAPVVAEPVALKVEPAPVSAPAPVVQPDPPPFPSVGQIANGLHENTITSQFGNPALSTVTSTGGHMVETFVYAQDRGRRSTVIRLEDGKVATVYRDRSQFFRLDYPHPAACIIRPALPIRGAVVL